MKEVLATVRMNKMNQTKEALVAAGFPAFTAARALGRGARPVDFEMVRALEERPQEGAEVLSMMSSGPRLIPKRLISLVVPDDLVPEVIGTLVKANQTGTPGDGKIFVLPITEVVRVRTGQTGAEAIDEMAGEKE